jgi:hypothetical protein
MTRDATVGGALVQRKIRLRIALPPSRGPARRQSTSGSGFAGTLGNNLLNEQTTCLGGSWVAWVFWEFATRELLFGFAPFPHLIAAHDYMLIIVDAHNSSWAMSP